MKHQDHGARLPPSQAPLWIPRGRHRLSDDAGTTVAAKAVALQQKVADLSHNSTPLYTEDATIVYRLI